MFRPCCDRPEIPRRPPCPPARRPARAVRPPPAPPTIAPTPRPPAPRTETAIDASTARAAPAPTPPAAPPPAEGAPPSPARPFVKWAGGKAGVADALAALAPPRIEAYYEPFAGGAALFFRLAADPERRPRRAVLNDLNAELTTAYEVVRDRPEALARLLAGLEAGYLARDPAGRAERYYEVRAQAPGDPVEIAARLIFLNKTCFNGLYRVNRRGRFNVPHGRYARPRILDRDALLAASAALAGAELRCADFEEACADAGPGDFVYCDPPFEPLSATSSFTSYTAEDFGREEQKRLKWLADDLRGRGAAVLVSNSPHEWVLGLYEGSRYRIGRIPARRAINARGNGRGPVDELAIVGYDPPAPAAAP